VAPNLHRVLIGGQFDARLLARWTGCLFRTLTVLFELSYPAPQDGSGPILSSPVSECQFLIRTRTIIAVPVRARLLVDVRSTLANSPHTVLHDTPDEKVYAI
jgi:hypothetical protein